MNYNLICPSFEEILSYEDGILDAASEKNIEEHLKQCPNCSKELEIYRLMKKNYGKIGQLQKPSGPCLTEGELGRFLSRTLEESQLNRVYRHLSECPVCRAELMEIGVAVRGVEFSRIINQWKRGKVKLIRSLKTADTIGIKEQRLAAAEAKRKKKPQTELISHEDITIKFEEADTEIKLEGYLSLYSSGELYVNFTNVDSTTPKYDETEMRIVIQLYKISSPPFKLKELKEKLGEYILIGKIGPKKKVDLASIEKTIRMEPIIKEKDV